MDALSETLRVVRLVGAIFIKGRFTAPWCYDAAHADIAAPILEPSAEKVEVACLAADHGFVLEAAGVKPFHVWDGLLYLLRK